MKVTVFTATFNRGYIIEKLYQSLRTQRSRNFEWIVIDDGSTDRTEELFRKWKSDTNDFEICYMKVKNGGKHRAINKGIEMAKGELFLIVDSDDYLTDNAVEQLIQWESSLTDKSHFSGFSGLRGKSHSEIIGSTFPGQFCDAYYTEREKFNIRGDKAEAFYTHVLKLHPFHEFENENFISEGTVWLPIGVKYKMRYYNEVIYICDYLDDGLSKNINHIVLRNPRGQAYYISIKIKYYNFNFKNRLASYYYYGVMYKNILSEDEIITYLQIKRIVFRISNMIFKTVNFVKKNLDENTHVLP